MTPTLRIQLLGEFRLFVDNQPVLGRERLRQQALLAYLLLHRHTPLLRQQVAFSFWPDSTEAQAYTNLRKLFFDLRQAFPQVAPFLFADNVSLGWRSDASCTLDVVELEEALEQLEKSATPLPETVKQVVALYRGELLASCYDDWIFPLRRALHERVVNTLEKAIAGLEAQRDYEIALRTAEHLLRLDPLHEGTYRLLMYLRALTGDRSGALRVYHECVTMLEEELGVPPATEIQTLYQQLLETETHATPASVVPPVQRREHVPLVGRKQEWQLLQQAWQQMAGRGPHLITIWGEAGMGKTRLVEELMHWVRLRPGIVAYARAYAVEGDVAYTPIIAWLRSEALRPALAKLEPLWLGELVRLLPELQLQHPTLPSPSPMWEGWQRQRFHEALARALMAAPVPRLLILDDLQWCDRETLHWLRYLLRFDVQAPLLVVGTVRSEAVDTQHPLHELNHHLQREGQITTLELGPLQPDETATLARELIGDVADVWAKVLHDESEGNPLFVVETVRARRFTDSNMSSPTVALPSTVQAVIAARLAQLTPLGQQVARLAATVGRAFTFEILAAAGDIAEDNLIQALDELWQRRLIREREQGYDFSHDKIREVAYAELSQVRRRFWHRRVAEALESIYAGRLDEVSGEVASHFEQANIIEKAASYWRRAGERAIAHSAFLDAATYLGRALNLSPAAEWEQHYELLLTRAKLYNHLGMRTEGKRDLEALQALVSTQDDHTEMAIHRRAEVALCLADFHRGLGEHPQARVAAQHATALAEACADVALAAQAYFLWGLSAFWDDAYFAQTRPQLQRALTLARQAGLQQSEAEVLSILALYGIYAGEPIGQIEAAAQQSLALFQKLGHPTGEAGALAMLSYIIYNQREGKSDLGIHYCERALQIVADFAGWDAERFALGCLGPIYCSLGDYGRARACLERGLAITRQVQNWRNEAGALFDIGCVYLEQGDYARAEAYLARSLQLYQEKGSEQHYRVRVLGLLALLYHQLGENSRARAYGEEALRFARKLGDPRVEAVALTRLGRVLVSTGFLDEATVLFQQAFSNFQSMEQYNLSMIALAGLAEVALHQDRLAEAQSRVTAILTHLQTHQLDRTDEELYVYSVGYRVLCAAKDARAADLLQMAVEQLQTRAGSLEDDTQKQMFWSVPVHAYILLLPSNPPN